ncbi:TPA: OmpA family protein [Pseudomonas aeruginosa]|nr:OmpA family protein [Pseudomonas aeruginosa]HBP1260953.1 OmpA family protein [Pseudomonas aeruginosa]
MPAMPHRQRASDKDLWSRTLSLVFLGFLCYAFPWSVFAAPLPIPTDDTPALRIQGSNTIGAKLLPALVEGLMEEEGLEDIRRTPGERENELHLLGKSRDGRLVRVELSAHGSSTGFTALLERHAELAAASRPVKDSEVRALAGFGDLRSPYAEQVIAIDGLAIILHPDNPLASLDTAQLAAVFAGEVRTWEELGGKGGAIRLYARDEQSGTYDTFKELVLASHGKSLASDARRFESNDRLAAAVSADPHAIGFVGIASVGRARALAIADGESLPMAPQESLIATEDYPLSRRLFLYLKPGEKNPWAQALVRFAQGPRGQAIVTRSGFVAQKIQAVQIAPRPQMPAEYRKLAEQARRLTVNFRFQEGSALLDNKALLDVQRLLDYLRQNRKLQERTVLVGFGDPKSDAERSVLLSRLRAMAVRRELARGGVSFREIAGFGDELPVASNDQELGRQKNRRVEVWIY